MKDDFLERMSKFLDLLNEIPYKKIQCGGSTTLSKDVFAEVCQWDTLIVAKGKPREKLCAKYKECAECPIQKAQSVLTEVVKCLGSPAEVLIHGIVHEKI